MKKLSFVCSAAALLVATPQISYAFSGYQSFNSLGQKSSVYQVNVNKEVNAAAVAFVDGLAKRGIDFLADENLSHEQRKKEFQQLLRTNFDMKTIGRFTLGRYWKTASDKEKKEYLKLFEDSVVNSYAKRFADYQGQQLVVNGSQKSNGNDVIVRSYIEQPNGQDVNVDWRVRKNGKGYKVVDVIVEGVSMAVTQRADFASVIQRGGGNVDVLLAHLRQQ